MLFRTFQQIVAASKKFLELFIRDFIVDHHFEDSLGRVFHLHVKPVVVSAVEVVEGDHAMVEPMVHAASAIDSSTPQSCEAEDHK